jgi:carbonic anhydrase
MKKLAFALPLSLLLCIQAVSAQVMTPDAAWKQLQDGNARYVHGTSIHPRIDAIKRRLTADQGQTPVAAILGCADSRVPPEIVFDQGFADLFVVRVAGNVCGIPELASIEYGVLVLKVPLIVVLGHTKCGAVDAAISKKELPGSLPELMSMIRPSVDKAEKETNSSEDLMHRTTKANVFHSMSVLMELSPIIREAVESKKLKIVGAVREIRDGHIDFIGEVPAKKEPVSAK